MHVFNLFPQHGLEELLGLVERLQNRIRDIDRTVGLDASILGEAISTRSLEQLRRLRDEDQDIIDELEREIELVSTDEMKFPLMLYLQQMGMEKIQSIPKGIGSGITRETGRPSGTFFAFQANDRHFWRVYTHDGEVISDKRRIFRYLHVPPDEQRTMPAGFNIYDLIDDATKDVLKEINSALRSQRLKPKLGTINRDLESALQQATLFETETTPENELFEKVLQVVQNISLDAFKRDKQLKAIISEYQSTPNQSMLVHQLDEFFIENELYRDVVLPKSTLEQVKADDLQLIAYEVFG